MFFLEFIVSNHKKRLVDFIDITFTIKQEFLSVDMNVIHVEEEILSPD